MPLDGRLANYILEGSKEGLIPDLDLKLKEATPLEIINGPLMDGMKEVGRLFNANELIVAEVLQSAEAMKAAVAHLEQFMEKATSSTGQGPPRYRQGRRARHRQEPRRDHSLEQRLQRHQSRHQDCARRIDQGVSRTQARRHRPVGPAREKRAADGRHGAGFEKRGNRLPDPGRRRGAVERFTRIKIAPEYPGLVAYANDAMSGLALANQIMDFEAARNAEGSRLDEDTAKDEFPASALQSPPRRVPPGREIVGAAR